MVGAQRAALVLGHARVAPLMAAGVGDFSFHSLVERHSAHGADLVGQVGGDPAERGHVWKHTGQTGQVRGQQVYGVRRSTTLLNVTMAVN